MLILAFVFLWRSLPKDKKYLKNRSVTHSAKISKFDYSVPKLQQMSTAFTNGLLLKINQLNTSPSIQLEQAYSALLCSCLKDRFQPPHGITYPEACFSSTVSSAEQKILHNRSSKRNVLTSSLGLVQALSRVWICAAEKYVLLRRAAGTLSFTPIGEWYLFRLCTSDADRQWLVPPQFKVTKAQRKRK